ncbi:c-type cytochrome domain-containing protein [Ulvibacterium sp.]|uniref:c-type cytochrome domain-containing protein n=1 Tax=Ulvibacterium sp. TaxID=2665914 RepID=UPI003CC50935
MELTAMLNFGFLEDPADILIFFGRFHPLVVHLPIGFLLLAAVAQFASRWPKFLPITPFLHYLWALGAISAFFAILFGYLLSLSGDYDTDTLFWHQWSGIMVLVLSLACYFIFKRQGKSIQVVKWSLVVLVVITIAYTGHLGGNLTHGSTYLLEYAPNPIRGMAGLPPKKEPRPKVTLLDSADIFLDLVQPMMDAKCISCHNPGKKKGDLLLTSYPELIKGSENGAVVTVGDAEASELFRRITLPENHDDFMPSEGKRPLTEEEVDIIEFWITAGALPKGYVTELDSKKEIVETVNTYLGLDQNTIFSQTVDPPNTSLIDSLTDSGFVVNRLMRDNYFLDANFSLSEREITQPDLDLLLGLKGQLVWLDLSHSGVTDTHLQQLGQLENLVKLNLSGNAISDDGIQHLSKLAHLESLNLYNTQISEGLLNILPQLNRLKSIYLWKTHINDTLAVRLQEEFKNIAIVYKREAFE